VNGRSEYEKEGINIKRWRWIGKAILLQNYLAVVRDKEGAMHTD
jgi:hypothetical protein